MRARPPRPSEPAHQAVQHLLGQKQRALDAQMRFRDQVHIAHPGQADLDPAERPVLQHQLGDDVRVPEDQLGI